MDDDSAWRSAADEVEAAYLTKKVEAELEVEAKKVEKDKKEEAKLEVEEDKKEAGEDKKKAAEEDKKEEAELEVKAGEDKKVEAETYDLTDEMAEKVKTKIHELMSMSPYVGGLQRALKENQWKTFVWCSDGMEALGTDSETDSTDVNHLDGLKANQSYFMQLPDRETSGEVVSEGHLQMLKALQQLLNLPGPRANRRANMEYCEFTSLPADTDVGLPVNKARPRGDIITFINCSDSKLSIVTADKKGRPSVRLWPVVHVHR